MLTCPDMQVYKNTKVLILCRPKVTTDSMGADQLAGTAWTIKGTD